MQASPKRNQLYTSKESMGSGKIAVFLFKEQIWDVLEETPWTVLLARDNVKLALDRKAFEADWEEV